VKRKRSTACTKVTKQDGTKHPVICCVHFAQTRSTSLRCYQSSCQLWEIFSHYTWKVNEHYQWDRLVLLSTAIKHVLLILLSFNRTGRVRATVKLLERELSTSLLLITALPWPLTAQQWTPLIVWFRECHISMSVCRESARLKKSSSDWLKSREVGYSIWVKRCNFCQILQRHCLDEVGK